MFMLLPLIVTFGGVYFLCKLRCFFILHPFKTVSEIVRIMKNEEARRSLSLALAGTLGVGNMVGVAVGIICGGPGSVLWMLVSSVFASVLKYAESTLSCDSGTIGMMSVISRSFKRMRFLPGVYAVSCLLLSLFMGAALQTRSVISSFEFVFSGQGRFVLIPFALFVIIVVFAGSKRVKNVTSIIIPIATISYVILCSAVIFIRIHEIPSVFRLIIYSAFSGDAAFGGAFGFICGRALSEGYARGLLSNEAGSGTSAFAHSDADYSHPTVAGLIGICEVIFDTVILCMLTALTILLSGVDISEHTEGMPLILSSVGDVIGKISYPVILFCVFAFALSTVVCWYSYGCICFSFLFKKGKWIFTVAFVASILIASIIEDTVFIFVTDYLMLILTAISILTIIKRSDRLFQLSEQNGLVIPRRRL